MSHNGDLQEKYRRLHYVLEIHPLLSGLMTDEHQSYLKDIMVSHRVKIPTERVEPDYELEIGWDDIETETIE